MNTEEFNKAVKPLSDKWTDDLVKDGLTNRPNLSEEEKEHYNDIALMKMNVCSDLIKENEDLKKLLNETIELADIMSDEIDKNWCKESKIAVGKLNLIIEKSGWIRP